MNQDPQQQPQQSSTTDKIAATFGLISALAGLVFFGIVLYAVIVIFF